MKTKLPLLILITTQSATAQKRCTVSGTIKSATTGETLIGASIRLKDIVQSGTVANAYGFYSLSATPGNYILVVS